VEVGVVPGHPVDHAMSGNLVDLCPAGALVDGQLEPGPPVWALNGVDSTCPGCARGCSIRIDVAENRIRRLKPRVNLATNQYWLCDEGRYGWDYVHSPQRLQRPALRGDGGLRTTSWEESLGRGTRSLVGDEGIAILTGGHLTNEEAYLLIRLAVAGWEAELTCLHGQRATAGDVRFPAGFTISQDRAPNATGFAQLASSAGLDLSEPRVLWKAVAGGQIRHVVVAGLGPDADLAEEVAGKLAQVETIVVMAALESALTEAAHVVLPGATFAEKDGTFTNGDRRVARVRPALSLPGDALPEWDILKRLLSHADLDQGELVTPAATLTHLSKTAKDTCFSGVTDEALTAADPRARSGGAVYGGGWATLLQRRGFFQVEDNTRGPG